MSEADWLPNTPEGNLESQAMELDADVRLPCVDTTLEAYFSGRPG